MPINTPHPEHDARRTAWARCRACFDGGDAVRAAGPEYLPMLGGQDSTTYEGYKKRATFYNAFARTVQALAGVLFRKPVTPVAPASLAKQWEDVTGGGTSLDLFALSAADELFKVGRAGLLVDAPSTGGDPYWCLYRAEDVISWDEQRVAGVPTLRRVVLQESQLKPSGDDPYALELAPVIRELFLDARGLYTVQRWEPRRAQGADAASAPRWEKADPPIQPLRRGAPIPFIPFTFVNAANLLALPEKPPLLDLADLNLSHYRTSADLEHGRHFTALPTPYVIGYDGKSGSLRIGSETAWAIGNETAKVGMLEFTGAGLSSLERALDHKEREMAVLGARLLEGQKAGVEAEGTVRLRHAGDDATLRVVAASLSAAVTRAMRWHAWWLGALAEPTDETVKYEIGVEFFSVRLAAQEVQALVSAYQAGAISFETLWWNLQRGDVARPDVTVDQERHDIEADAPDTADPADPADPADQQDPTDPADPADPADAAAGNGDTAGAAGA